MLYFPFVIIFFRLGTASPEFIQGLVIGGIARVFRRRYTMRRGRNAGSLLARLFAWHNLRENLLWVAVAVSLYFIADQFAFGSAWIGYATGVGVALAALIALEVSALTQLDLRDDGIMLQNEAYWPWSEVKLIEWDRETSGRLVIGRSWKRVVAKVPPEQREAIDIVLRGKVVGTGAG